VPDEEERTMKTIGLPLLALAAAAVSGAASRDGAGGDDLETLRRLNHGYTRAFVEADAAWYREHLAEDFVCTLGDGRRIDKAEFLSTAGQAPTVADISFDEPRVRLMGDAALVHGATHYTGKDGKRGTTVYTDVYERHDGRWLAVAAQLTRVAQP
jgi:ketosteroid isomerase-like protein